MLVKKMEISSPSLEAPKDLQPRIPDNGADNGVGNGTDNGADIGAESGANNGAV